MQSGDVAGEDKLVAVKATAAPTAIAVTTLLENLRALRMGEEIPTERTTGSGAKTKRRAENTGNSSDSISISNNNNSSSSSSKLTP